MNTLTFKLGANNSKLITCAKTSSVEDLRKMIESVFNIHERVVGVTDENGKYFDLEFVNQNMGTFRSHAMSLVLAKDGNQENMSFASDNIEFYPLKRQSEKMHSSDYPQQLFNKTHGLLGFINDLKSFEQLLLEDNKPAIIICTKRENFSKIQIPYNFYIKEPLEKSENVATIIMYFDHKKIGELYVKNWRNIENMIEGLMKNLIDQDLKGEEERKMNKLKSNGFKKESQRPQTGYMGKKRRSEIKNDEEQPQAEQESDQEQIELRESSNSIEADQIKNTFLQNLNKLREQETISELQFYKLKSKLLENPEEFMRKYQMGTRQGLRKQKSIDELRDEIIRSKQEKSRYQTIINEFREGQNSGDNFGRGYKNQIPIIVRKYNNVIEKISTSYPLTLQQEQAINLIMQLQLKGLISQTDSRDYKAQILQQNQPIFELFQHYFDEKIDQIELTRRLKNKNKIDRKTLEQKKRSEEVVRGIIKYAKRNSFELLRNLALQGNIYVLKCFESFEQDKNEQNLAISLEKVANYYRSKSSLENRLHIADL